MAPPATIATIIARAIAPYLGEHMARSAVFAHLEKLGIRDAEPTDAQLAELLRNVQLGLVVFVGREKSVRIVDEVRATLDSERKRR